MDQSILQNIITGIHVRSNVAPDLDIVDPFNPNPASNPVLAASQPQVTLDVLGSSSPIVIAPYGTPGPYGGAAAAGGSILSLGVLGLALYGGYRLLFK